MLCNIDARRDMNIFPDISFCDTKNLKWLKH